MNFLHYELNCNAGDTIEVTLDSAANVQLLDSSNYYNYRQGKPYRYVGGYAKESPCRLRPPHAGKWHLVIDLGGYAGTVRANARVLRAMMA